MFPTINDLVSFSVDRVGLDTQYTNASRIAEVYAGQQVMSSPVDALWGICGAAQGALGWMLMALIEMGEFGKVVGRSWIDIVEVIADFAIAVIASLAIASVWFPLWKGILGIAIIVCIVSIWMLMTLG